MTLTLALLASLVGCGGNSTGALAGNTEATATPAAFPVTVTDCGGRQTTYDKAPERVFALDDWTMELLVSLGLRDKIVGYARFITDDSKVWDKHRAEILSLPVVGGGTDYPSQEEVVARQPDLVMAIAQSAFAEKSKMPSRDGWKAFGANTYLAAGDCDVQGGTSTLSDFEYLYRDLHELGKVFGISDRAEKIIADMQSRVNAATAKVKDKPQLTMWNYAGEKVPLIAGGPSVPNAIMTQAGVRNVFGDNKEAYAEVSFEEVVNRNPDVIWIMPDSGASGGFIDEASGIEAKILSDSRLANLTAVKKKAFVIVSFNAGGVATPRNIDALESMVDQLDKLR